MGRGFWYVTITGDGFKWVFEQKIKKDDDGKSVFIRRKDGEIWVFEGRQRWRMKVILAKKRYLPWLKVMAKKAHDICGVNYQILLQYIVAIFSGNRGFTMAIEVGTYFENRHSFAMAIVVLNFNHGMLWQCPWHKS